jgi:radical SAM superfamily enzyme YgiQ (UPF0313 family)
MRSPGEILLIACYEMGHQPLAVAWPTAFLERAGYAPAVLDLSVEPLDPEKIRRARLVAISVPMHTALRLGVRVAARVRELHPGVTLVFYGLYAALNADYLTRDAHAAAVIAGELETELVDFARRLESSGSDGQPTPRRVTVIDKLDFPTPSRAALPSLKKYAHLDRDGSLELVAHVEASRGCKHTCTHCPIPPVYGGRFFVVPLEVVLADVRQQVAAGATHVSFGDPDFLNGPGHALAVTRAVHAEFGTLTFDFTAKIEHLLRQRHHLPELAACGCLFIVSAAESLDDRVLSVLDKGHTGGDVVTAVEITRAVGITLRPTWVAFTPWTTLEGYRAWLDFIDQADLVDAVDPVQYGLRLLVPPGSLLLQHPEMRPHLGRLVADAFYYEWTHPDPQMDTLQAAVTKVVAAAADRREDAGQTFQRVRTLADEAAGVAPRPMPTKAAARRRAPRLTEPWFC